LTVLSKLWWSQEAKYSNRLRQTLLQPVGTEVLLENTAQKQRKGGKLEPAWLGPYTIHRCIGKGLYELSKDAKVVKKKANVARLKIYRKRTRGNDEEKDGPPTKKVY